MQEKHNSSSTKTDKAEAVNRYDHYGFKFAHFWLGGYFGSSLHGSW